MTRPAVKWREKRPGLVLLLSSLFSSISLRNQTSPTADVSRDPSRFHGNLAHESCLGLLSRLSAVMVSWHARSRENKRSYSTRFSFLALVDKRLHSTLLHWLMFDVHICRSCYITPRRCALPPSLCLIEWRSSGTERVRWPMTKSPKSSSWLPKRRGLCWTAASARCSAAVAVPTCPDRWASVISSTPYSVYFQHQTR